MTSGSTGVKSRWGIRAPKPRQGGRLGEVSTRVVFGTPEAVATRVADSPVSATVTTSVIARDTLTQRQSHRRFTRRTNGFSTDLT